jgi:mannonate dehydratase
MKLTMGTTDLSDDTLNFARQYGVSHLKINLSDYLDPEGKGRIRIDDLLAAKSRINAADLQIGVALLPQAAGSLHWNIRLGLPERERDIEDVFRTLEAAGKAEIPVIEYVFNLAAVYGSTSRPTARGNANVRHFDYTEAAEHPAEPGFEATEDEVWERIGWFLNKIIPVAESVGVKLACHPDDPPVPKLLGETRVLGSFDGLKRLVALVPSESNGLNFCQGTVAEMGENVIEVIRHFGSRGKIHHVHFRNIKRALPEFEESFIDDGDTDMWEALRAYKETGYTGTIMPDHVPDGVGGALTGRAYALGYMRAMMKALDVLDT